MQIQNVKWGATVTVWYKTVIDYRGIDKERTSSFLTRNLNPWSNFLR